MISFNLKSFAAIAIICFVLGCCVTFLLTSKCNNEVKPKSFISPKVLHWQADSIEASYKVNIIELESRNEQLQQELNLTKLELNAVKAKSKSKAATIKKIIDPKGYPAKELLEKADPSLMVMNSGLSTCDSLVQEVNEYVELNEVKDSLYEVQISIRDNLITSKDSIIAFKTEKHKVFSSLFNQSLQDQQKMLSENNRLRRRIKLQKLKGKLFAIGTGVLSGLATHYLTR